VTRQSPAADVTVKAETDTKTIFIVSSHCLFREAIEQLIESPGFTTVGTDTDFVEVLREAGNGTQPNLVIIILDPDQDAAAGLERLKELHGRLGNTKTMILLPSEQQVAPRAAVQSGVDAILTTKVSGAVLRHVIELVFLGQRMLPPEVVSLVDDGPVSRCDAMPALAALALPKPLIFEGRGVPVLSIREREILRGLVSGWPNKVIARQLAITEATVKVHMKALLRKIQMTNRTQAAIWAINNGLETQNHHQWSDGATPARQPEILLPMSQPDRNYKAEAAG
jgi:two-component system, NarL family, nitrate/nitrite response regulator NarL